MEERLLSAALAHIRQQAAAALGYSSGAAVEWLPGYEGRYAGVWEEGQWGTFSLWRLEALGMVVTVVGMDAEGRWKLWGRQGSGYWRPGMSKVREMFRP